MESASGLERDDPVPRVWLRLNPAYDSLFSPEIGFAKHPVGNHILSLFGEIFQTLKATGDLYKNRIACAMKIKINGGDECAIKISGAGKGFTRFTHMMSHHMIG